LSHMAVVFNGTLLEFSRCGQSQVSYQCDGQTDGFSALYNRCLLVYLNVLVATLFIITIAIIIIITNTVQ